MKKKAIETVIDGEMKFCRTGQNVTFTVSNEALLNNRVVQFPMSILPEDYSPDKYEVTGSFEYRIEVKRK